MRAALRRRAGAFTIIELTVSMAILAFGLLAILSMVTTGYSNIFASGTDTWALMLAQQRLDQLRSLPYTDAALNAGDHTDSLSSEWSRYARAYRVEQNPTLLPAAALMKRITVTVTGPRGRRVELVTMVTQ
jgi:Tfp pilus assembly protein PilV